MIFFLAATILLFVYALPVFASRLAREQRGASGDVFSPVFFLSVLGLLNVPYLYLLAFNPGARSVLLLEGGWVRDLEATAVHYVLLMAVSFGLLLAGLASRLPGTLVEWLPVIPQSRFTRARVDRALLLCIAAGTALYLYYIYSIGGLQNLWMQMYLRTVLTQGTGYLGTVYKLLLTLGAVLLVYRLRFRGGRFAAAATMLVVILIMLVLASTGGRAATLHVLIACVMVHHYTVRPRRRWLTPGVALVAGLVLFFVMLVPAFRTTGAFERYSAHPSLLLAEAGRDFGSLAGRLSQFDRSAVMLNYFTIERLWLGRGYLDLFTAPVPRLLYPRKPPVDDGVYFNEIMMGRTVVPPKPAAEMRASSQPMGNLVMYMNFGWVGLLLGLFVVGAGIGTAYLYMQRTGYAVHSVFLYQFAVFGGLNLSVYGIVGLMMTVVITASVFWVLFAVKRWPRPAAPPGLAGVRGVRG